MAYTMTKESIDVIIERLKGLEENFNIRIKGLEQTMNLRMDQLHEEQRKTFDQATRTNGRVNCLEDWMADHDIKEANLLSKYDKIVYRYYYWLLGLSIICSFFMYKLFPDIFMFTKSFL